ncbi:hypothetical protein GLOTRDRAFT_139969 [Gloeophyllum trabeum ATCC 11539]|uniref:Uncharacterized protein n=1 Tax=Gloeophyllum trabeum (strain ATCC 11539 / FP-39264 / Madison 617) TaxID=670483 RepID=S7Q0M1_GLOTA|nr:uncharacterized protein GLOTRDRAFT_139969 [Gloeophyllum trabeum ATCC 11539]EPQ53012.1 hypothetical protein GLOTRDRAFT_139969 [Gloeophyllum trabeum ATCC 11539]
MLFKSYIAATLFATMFAFSSAAPIENPSSGVSIEARPSSPLPLLSGRWVPFPPHLRERTPARRGRASGSVPLRIRREAALDALE